MALPTSYTEEELAGYMASPAVLGTTADLLAWTWDGGDYNEIINRVLEIANVDDVAEMTGKEAIVKLRALARYAAWEAAVSGLVTEFDVSADGASMGREAIYQHAERELQKATDKIVDLGFDPDGTNTAKLVTVTRSDDPYQPHEVVREFLARLNS
ncbi:MAG: hypothetical protein H6658_02100 [Ardenticatenaceae bacterium]|nr:hypothetical protein [Ardenticatenaceae bacterium]